ncbi:MAG: hypothetical protein R2860_09080 [Desulfobacterales bacterium]
MQKATEENNEKKGFRNNQELLGVGISINAGNAIIGNIGSSNRMDYTYDWRLC